MNEIFNLKEKEQTNNAPRKKMKKEFQLVIKIVPFDGLDILSIILYISSDSENRRHS